MKIIQAMKQIKDLQRKADDLKSKVKLCCADMNYETPLYGSEDKQRQQISEWLQAHNDILKEILRLRVAIQLTNIKTDVTIELGGKSVTKSIAAWIHRRRDLANNAFSMYQGLTDRGLKEGFSQTSTGAQMEVKIRRYFDPSYRDKMMELYRSEPTTIDSTLEVINAVTDLIEE